MRKDIYDESLIQSPLKKTSMAGDFGWVSNDYMVLSMCVGDETLLNELIYVDTDNEFPFQTKDDNWRYFYPAPYYYQQKLWLEESELKIKDKIKITHKWVDGENGFSYSFMEQGVIINETYTVEAIWNDSIQITGGKFVPFFVIRKDLEDRESYAIVQKQWVEENNLQKDDRIMISDAWFYQEKGFSGNFNDLGININDVGVVVAIHDNEIYIRMLDGTEIYAPYFGIKKIPYNTKPFESKEDFRPHRGSWFIEINGGDVCKVTKYNDGYVEIDGQIMSYQTFHDRYFYEGTVKNAGL